MSVFIQMGKPQFQAYYVSASSVNDENADLIVISDDPEKVPAMWKAYAIAEWGKEDMEVEGYDFIRVMPWAKVKGPTRCVDWAESPSVYLGPAIPL